MSSNPVLARDLDDDEPSFVPPKRKKRERERERERAKKLASIKVQSPLARVVGGVAAIAGFAASYWVVQRAFGTARDVDMRSVAVLQQIANDMNKRTPMQIDQETELVTTVVPEKGIFEYRYRLISLRAAEFDAPKVLAEVKPMTRNSSCSTPATRKIIDRGVTLRYSYMDTDGVYFGGFDITAKDCTAP